MPTTIDDIRGWIEDAPKNATHMLVICDTFDWEDYPVYVDKKENLDEVKSKYDGKNMQKIMEVYNLQKNTNKQLNKYRANEE